MTFRITRAALSGAALFLFHSLLLAQSAAVAQQAQRAQQHLADGRFPEAAQIYEQLTRALPGNPGLLMNLGMARFMAGQDAAAVGPLEAALKLPGAPPQTWLFLGAARLKLGQPAQALAPLRRFAALDPQHREVRQMLADAASATGQPQEAATHLTQLATWEPAQPAIWYALGRAWEAVASEQMSKLPPDSGYWLALAAEGRNRRRQNRAGFLLYRKALEKLPTLRGLHQAIAEIYRNTNHADWAAMEDEREKALGAPACPSLECHFGAQRYAAVLASPAATPEARYWKSRAAAALAQQAFEKLESLGNTVVRHRYQAERLREEGRHAEAVAAWREALSLELDNPALRFELASSLLQTKEFAEASALVTTLLRADPQAAEFHQLQGEILLAQQQPDAALPHLAQAVKLDPSVLPARASYGRALLLLDRASEAIAHLKAALPLDTDASLHFQLARAYQATGQTALAQQLTAQVQSLRAKAAADQQRIETESEITAPLPAAPRRP
jgi:predicted Zn-dependent protease